MGWAGPVGPAAAAVAKSLSDTEGMGHGGTRSRYPYFVPRIRMLLHNLISVFGDGASRPFWTIDPHERRTSTLKYLFVFSSASDDLFFSVLFYLLLALRYISESFQVHQIDDFAVIPPTFSSITHTNLKMAGSAPAASKDIKSVLENKPLKFKFKTGGASYVAQVHTDRSS